VKEYNALAKTLPDGCIYADMLRRIAENEAEHAGIIQEMIVRLT
jgi:rubrerythrin